RYEEKIISLICSIAEKVVLARVEIDDEIVKETVMDALLALPEPEDIILSVSTEDYEYIEMVKEELFDFIKTLKSVSVISDTSVKRGGCRIETKEGSIEADIEEKLEKVFSSIRGAQLT
ncbi:MAG: flagellar biosynthesis/type III secretory pathway protein, partial [Desulfobacteraceae bacterium]|nr:flagellar biosynthesis/type III secretory pathway protein [Desulfobacteraceae bacterium]